MESKRKNVYITIFVITTIIAGAIAVYFGIDANKKQQELESQVAKVDENLSKNEDNTTKTNIEVKEVEKTILAKYDPEKVKNKPENVEYTNKIMYGQAWTGLGIQIINGKPSLTVYYNNNSKEITVNGLSDKVEDVCQGTLGDGANEGIVFLMENGDVYFVDNLYNALNQYNGTGILNPEKVNSVSNICRVIWTMSGSL